MELHPHTTPIRDPFFAALRRRRPDVDIVLLPPERLTPQPDPVDDTQVAATLERVTDRMTHLWQIVAGADGDRPRIRLGYGPDVGTVVASARGTAGVDDGFGRLVRLRHELESGGWRVRRLAGASERLAGRHATCGSTRRTPRTPAASSSSSCPSPCPSAWAGPARWSGARDGGRPALRRRGVPHVGRAEHRPDLGCSEGLGGVRTRLHGRRLGCRLPVHEQLGQAHPGPGHLGRDPADGLRTTIADYLATDGRASQDYVGLLVYTEEIR